MAIANQAPADNATEVRRDWSITADITATGGVDSVATSIDGTTVTDTETSITNGKRVTYTPSSSSSYGARVLVKMIATLTKAITWATSTDYTTSDIRIGSGVHYECTTAGTSAGTEPTWPTTIDDTVTDNDSDDWAANTTYSAGAMAAPATANSYNYEVTTAGKSLSSEPTFPTTAGNTVAEAVSTAWAADTDYLSGDLRRPSTANGYNYECTTSGKSGSSEPTWGTTVGGTTSDGGAVWTCRAQLVWTCRAQPVWTCKDDDYTYEWRFSVEKAAATATSSPPPEVVVVKDISLTTDEADEAHGSINVVWLADKTHPLIVTEAQAEAVGTVEVENNVYHRHVRTLRVDRTDDSGDEVSSLKEGDLITFTASALSETTKKAEVLAIRQIVGTLDVQYDLVVQYYEAV